MQRRKISVLAGKHWLFQCPALLSLRQLYLFLFFNLCFQRAGFPLLFLFLSPFFFGTVFEHVSALRDVTVCRDLILNIEGLILFQKSMD